MADAIGTDEGWEEVQHNLDAMTTTQSDRDGCYYDPLVGAWVTPEYLKPLEIANLVARSTAAKDAEIADLRTMLQATAEAAATHFKTAAALKAEVARLREIVSKVPIAAMVDKLGWRTWLEAREGLQAALNSTNDPAPIDMLLWCPRCHTKHVDEASEGWDNPPHRSHLCHACGCIWRPADVPTNGVHTITSAGKADNFDPAPAASDVEPVAMTAEEHRLEDLKQQAQYNGPVVSFDVAQGYYLASCDHCGWVGSSENCGTDSFGDDSDVYCPRCSSPGADCGKVAQRLAHPPADTRRSVLEKALRELTDCLVDEGGCPRVAALSGRDLDAAYDKACKLIDTPTTDPIAEAVAGEGDDYSTKIMLWFFRDILEEHRRAFIKLLFGAEIADEARTEHAQRMLLRRALRAIRKGGDNAA